MKIAWTTRCVSLALFVCACSQGTGTAPLSPSPFAQNGFSEEEIATASLTVRPHHAVVVQMKHAASSLIPYRFPHGGTFSFCMEDDDGQAHAMSLVDGEGRDVVSIQAGEGCTAAAIPAGSYVQKLVHDGSGDPAQANTLFIQPRFEGLSVDALQALRDGTFPSSQGALAVKTQDGSVCAYFDTWALQSNDGYYLSIGGVWRLVGLYFLSTRRDVGDFNVTPPALSFFTAPGTDELFKVYDCGAGRLAFQAANGGFLTMSNPPELWNPSSVNWPGFSPVTTIGAQEMFTFAYHDDATITLQTSDGSYWNYIGTPPVRPTDLTHYVSTSRQIQATSHFIPTHQIAIYLLTGECRGCNLQGVNLTGYNLQGVRLSNAHLEGSILSNAFMPDAQLDGAHLERAQLQNVDFYGMEGQASLEGATLTEARFGSSNLMGLNLHGAHLDGADFTGARLLNARLSGIEQVYNPTTKENASFVDALLAGADFSDSTFDGVNFTNAILSTKANTVDLTFRNSPTTSITAPFDFGPTVRPLSTTDHTTCPDGNQGPCAADPQWVAKSPPAYQGYDDPNNWISLPTNLSRE